MNRKMTRFARAGKCPEPAAGDIRIESPAGDAARQADCRASISAALYALDALPPDEAESFEAHLADCASCTEEVAALQEVAADLSGLTVATPPGDLRASVMAAIDDVAQVPLASEEPDEVVEEPERVVSIRPDATEPASGTTGEAQVVSLAEHRRARWTARVATGVAAALVLVAGALGLWASDLNGQVDELTGQVGDLDR